jgi:hypothetical protein
LEEITGRLHLEERSALNVNEKKLLACPEAIGMLMRIKAG